MTGAEYVFQELLPEFFPWLWSLVSNVFLWGICIVVAIAVLGTVAEVAGYVWKRIAQTGIIIREDQLSKQFYRVIFVGMCDNHHVLLLQDNKGDIISCRSEPGKNFQLFTIVGEAPNQFLVPIKAEKIPRAKMSDNESPSTIAIG